MRFEPFNKANCIAMLNTLYPPTTATPPTRLLTAAILAAQRSAFFRYITAVEKNGKTVLTNLENQGRRPEKENRPADLNGWAVVREIVDKYLRTANAVIEECMDVGGIEYFEAESEAFRRNERRADSGVSFATGDRPTTSDNASGKTSAPPPNKPLPRSPATAPLPLQIAPPVVKKRGTTLERIAREFRNLRNRNDVKEMPGRKESFDKPRDDSKDFLNKSQGLRKMKSTTSIRDRKIAHSRSNSDEPVPGFDFDAKRRQLILSKQMEKENKIPGQGQRMHGPSIDLRS